MMDIHPDRKMDYILCELLWDLKSRVRDVLITPRDVDVEGIRQPATLLPSDYFIHALADLLEADLANIVFKNPAYMSKALALLNELQDIVVESAAEGRRVSTQLETPKVH